MYFMFCVWIVTERKKGDKFSGRIIDLRGCWRYNKTVSGSVSFLETERRMDNRIEGIYTRQPIDKKDSISIENQIDFLKTS